MMRAFDRGITFIDLLLGLWSHVWAYAIGCWLGWCALLLFQKANAMYSAALLGVVLSLAAGGIEGSLPNWGAHAVWLIPPVYRLMVGLTDYEAVSTTARWLYFGYPAVYAAVGFTIALRFYVKRSA